MASERCVRKHVLAMVPSVASSQRWVCSSPRYHDHGRRRSCHGDCRGRGCSRTEAALAAMVAGEAAVTQAEEAALAARAAEVAAARKTFETAAVVALAHRVFIGALDIADNDKELRARLGAHRPSCYNESWSGCNEGCSRGRRQREATEEGSGSNRRTGEGGCSEGRRGGERSRCRPESSDECGGRAVRHLRSGSTTALRRGLVAWLAVSAIFLCMCFHHRGISRSCFVTHFSFPASTSSQGEHFTSHIWSIVVVQFIQCQTLITQGS